jgi:hypothetical protein
MYLEVSAYLIELLAQLKVCRIHDQFHCSKLHAYSANDDTLFPHQEAHLYYDYGMPNDQEWLVDKILAHKWDKKKLSFQIHWNLSTT